MNRLSKFKETALAIEDQSVLLSMEEMDQTEGGGLIVIPIVVSVVLFGLTIWSRVETIQINEGTDQREADTFCLQTCHVRALQNGRTYSGHSYSNGNCRCNVR